jgi:hypothetical protein
LNQIQRIAAVALAAMLAPAAWAAGNQALAQAQQQFKQERAHCLSGQSQQDRATCLKEAGAAYEEARRGALANPSGTNLGGNAVERCKAQPAADREACVQRIMGAGTAEGSVEGGGIIRSTETPVK